ncbi:Nuclear elongation and deformation protein 1 [Entophlyctis luteolus]|nr:Nuclear elongation and deformation protein 1 [Entophlyctis luteolus]
MAAWYVQDWFILFPNLYGWLMGSFYTLCLLSLSPPKTRNLSIGCLLGIMTCIQIITGCVFIANPDYSVGSQVLGVMSNIALVIFYGSPLSTCAKVIKTRNSVSLNLPLAVASIINGSMWAAYGFALHDYYVSAPNLMGVLFALLQVALIWAYPRTGGDEAADGSTAAGVLREVASSDPMMVETRSESSFRAVTSFYNDINPATLSGAIDIVVVRGENGALSCSPFHVRFGKLVLLRPTEKKEGFPSSPPPRRSSRSDLHLLQVIVTVNGTQCDIPMKVGEAGEAFFVVEIDTDEPAPSEYATSPIIKPSPSMLIETSSNADAFDLGQADTVGMPPSGAQQLPDHEGAKLSTVGVEIAHGLANQAAAQLATNLPDRDDTIQNNAVVPSESPEIVESNLQENIGIHAIGSPEWEWNWGGLPRKNEDESEGLSRPEEQHVRSQDVPQVNSPDVAVDDTTQQQFAFDRITDFTEQPIASSSLTSALKAAAGSSDSSSSHVPTFTGVSVDDLDVAVSADEKVDKYLNSLADERHMASPDRSPSVRARSPSPIPLSAFDISSIFGKVTNDDAASKTLPEIQLSTCAKQSLLSALQAVRSDTVSDFDPVFPTFSQGMLGFAEFQQEIANIRSDVRLIARIVPATRTGNYQRAFYCDWNVLVPAIISVLVFGQSLSEESMTRLVAESGVGGLVLWKDASLMAASPSLKLAVPPTSPQPSKPSGGGFGGLRSWWSRSGSGSGGAAVAAAVAVTAASNTAPLALSGAQAGDDAAGKGGENGTPDADRADVESALETMSNVAIDEDISKTRKRYVKSLRMTNEQLQGLNLKTGVNNVSFTVTSRLQGTATCHAKLFLWEHNTKVVISDVDGTITKSDVLGHVMTIVGQDWTHSGVASLYTNIHKNGYEILYLTSRAIGQANYTRDYLKKVEQGDFQLPEGPIVMSPDRLFAAFHREVIQRRPEEFKIQCLRDIKKLFGPTAMPFVAGFGNRVTDVQSYRAVDVPLSRIFTIDPSGQIKLEFTSNYQSSYAKLNEIVDGIFPPIGGSQHVSSPKGLDSSASSNEAQRGGKKVHENDTDDGDDEWAVWKRYLPEAVVDMTTEAKLESGVAIAAVAAAGDATTGAAAAAAGASALNIIPSGASRDVVLDIAEVNADNVGGRESGGDSGEFVVEEQPTAAVAGSSVGGDTTGADAGVVPGVTSRSETTPALSGQSATAAVAATGGPPAVATAMNAAIGPNGDAEEVAGAESASGSGSKRRSTSNAARVTGNRSSVVEITANESGAVEVEVGLDEDDGEFDDEEYDEEYEDDDDEVDEDALKALQASEDDETVRARMAEMKKMMSCAPSDIRALASTLGGADGDNSRVPQDGGVADDREYDVSCLDYSYLAKATTKSVPELKRLLDILRDMLDRDAAARDIDAWVLAMKSSSTASAAAAAPSPAVPVRHRLAPRDSAVSIATAASSQTVSSFQAAAAAASASDSDLPHSSQLVSSCESSCASSSNSSPASRRASYTSILKASSGFGSSSPAATSSSFPSSTKHVRFLDEVEAARKEADRIKRKQERRKRQIEMHLQQAANSSTVPNSHASTKKNKRKSKTSNSSRKYSGESDSSTGVVEIPFAVDGNDSDEVHEICTPGFQQSLSSAAPIQIPTSKHANSATRIRSYDYRAWDMFDVEKELEKIDELPADREPSSTARINPYKSNSSVVPILDEPSALFEDDIVATSLAEAEKLKGNEAFKAKEYDDAVSIVSLSA